ncbi:type I-F CRISPR-associated endonuclease Cas1f [Thauera sinica]|uniref:CRISPR-associated endonuclease Cas1 n=1 Tax=Thauera sinica TaxID=2665146 RepID=A0ABW1APE0_9RHOO|nr:type I-F CRISPR-associated endonuclease Cas1f [Thauera sp. K11]ATE59496.1 subtype I-F CRISPR-associated endonuclease Cas1 [Thauera sp. K11]
MSAPRAKPRQILLSRRANIFYLEHARVLQRDERIVWLTESGEDVEQYFNLPERNTALLLLGKGTSITDAAMRRLAESNVLVGFCGSGGSPLFAVTEPVFLTPQSEYRPTEYMQSWVRLWMNDSHRLELAKALIAERISLTEKAWGRNADLLQRRIVLPPAAAEKLRQRSAAIADVQTLLLAEAEWARALYASLSAGYGLQFTRNEGAGARASKEDRINSFLDHGNYIAYGLAAVALNGLGISYAFPLLHGKTRRGALVFDIADLIKDAYVMPLAFECGADTRIKDNTFRARLIEVLQEADALDFLFGFVKTLSEKYP